VCCRWHLGNNMGGQCFALFRNIIRRWLKDRLKDGTWLLIGSTQRIIRAGQFRIGLPAATSFQTELLTFHQCLSSGVWVRNAIVSTRLRQVRGRCGNDTIQIFRLWWCRFCSCIVISSRCCLQAIQNSTGLSIFVTGFGWIGGNATGNSSFPATLSCVFEKRIGLYVSME